MLLLNLLEFWKDFRFLKWRFSFEQIQDFLVTEDKEMKPATMNAFELISRSSGLNISGLFEESQVQQKFLLLCRWISFHSVVHFFYCIQPEPPQSFVGH
jgi:hypothetical protein